MEGSFETGVYNLLLRIFLSWEVIAGSENIVQDCSGKRGIEIQGEENLIKLKDFDARFILILNRH